METAKLDTFMGYERSVGSPGIRNYLLVLNATGLTDATARRVSANLAGSVYATTMSGMGMLGDDASTHLAALFGLATNPNCGAVLLLSADRPKSDKIQEVLAASGKPFISLCLDQVEHDCLRMTDLAIRAGAGLLRSLSRQRCEQFSIDRLCVGMECGLSDPSSGMAANPLLGRVTDYLVDAGATVIVGETLEWLGTETQLSKRGATPEVARDIVEAVTSLEKRAIAAGVDLLGINPNAANIRGGLTTIEEKASGSIAKSGSRPIRSVLNYGRAPTTPGIHLMNAASYTPESLTGFVAAGAQMILFTTGLGNSYVSALAPTIKVSANARTIANLPEQIDFDASAIIDGQSPDILLDYLLSEMGSIAGGSLTLGEILGEGNENISRFGPSL